MRTRVVVLLASQAGYINTYHKNLEDAKVFIREWRDRQRGRIEGSKLNEVEATLYQDDEESPTWSVLGQWIIGMYVADESSQTAQDKLAEAQTKIADAVSKEYGHGEEWKDT